MRLPFLQVSQVGLARARTMARLLRIPEAHGVGIYVSLTAWALEMAPDGDLSGRLQDQDPAVLLAAAVGWDGTPEDLMAAMERTSIIMRDASGTHAVTGLEVYERALASSDGRKMAASVAARSRWHGKTDASRMLSASTSHSDAMRPDAKTQTQTQTQTQNEVEDLPPASRPAPRVELRLEPQQAARKTPKPKPEKTADPRHAPLVLALTDAGWPFDGPKDAAQVKALLALADQQAATRGAGAVSEVLRRAAIAWGQFPSFRSARTLSGLRSKWGDFAEAERRAGAGPPPVSDWSQRQELPPPDDLESEP